MTHMILQFGKRAIKSSAAPFSRVRSTRPWPFNDSREGAGKVVIFGYHRIVADIALAEQDAIFGLVTSTETFRRHLEIIRERYDVVTMDEAAAVMGGAGARRAVAAITFDDGYRDVYEQAFPVLREFNLPATVFVASACTGPRRLLDHDRLYWFVQKAHWRGLSLHVPLIKAGLDPAKAAIYCAEVDPLRLCNQLVYLPFALRQTVMRCLGDFLGEAEEYPEGYGLLDWEMMREMAGAGISFGAHTDNHVVLTLEERECVEREISRSKQIIEEKLGQRVDHFAYPNGEYNAEVRSATARAGFKSAVTTDRRANQRGGDLFALSRICLCEESTRGISGRYSEAVGRMRLIV